MIRAGLLKERLVFKALTPTASPTGFKKNEYKEVLRTRAYKKKSKGIEQEQAKELFNTHSITFVLRFNKLIKESQIVTYNGNDYTIGFLDKTDNTLELILNKKDK